MPASRVTLAFGKRFLDVCPLPAREPAQRYLGRWAWEVRQLQWTTAPYFSGQRPVSWPSWG